MKPLWNNSPRRVNIITHMAGEPTPAHHLARVMEGSGWEVRLLTLPFVGSTQAFAELSVRYKGRLLESRQGRACPKSIWSQLAGDPFTTFALLKGLPKADLTVALDNLNAFCALIEKKRGRTGTVVYYVIDHTPKRFGNPLLNWLYARFDAVCCKGADYLWTLSPRMEEAKAARGASQAKMIRTPIGVGLEAFRKRAPRRDTKSLVVVSFLDRSKGVQLAIQVMPQVLRQVPGASLTIIGGGPYDGALRAMAEASPACRRIRFLGRVKDHAAMLSGLRAYGVGLAPYLEDASNYSYYADPAKPKEYLAAGLPVIITRVPWIAEAVDKAPLGLAISYNEEELVKACVRLLKDLAFQKRCRTKAAEFSKDLAWKGIFKGSLAQSGFSLD